MTAVGGRVGILNSLLLFSRIFAQYQQGLAGLVGIVGYLLQGGISVLSAHYGLAADVCGHHRVPCVVLRPVLEHERLLSRPAGASRYTKYPSMSASS